MFLWLCAELLGLGFHTVATVASALLWDVTTFRLAEIYKSRSDTLARTSHSSLASSAYTKTKTKLNSVALVRERTIPTEQPPLVSQLLRIEGVAWSAQRIPMTVF
jgi:hypothetical protein